MTPTWTEVRSHRTSRTVGPAMTVNPDEFDHLYKEVRDSLLLEAYALTGDLGVSRTAVRDSFAVAWHHWNKVQKVDDKVAWLRPYVWRRARQRHTVRPWHKEKNLTESVSATLAALDQLSLNQRKALVLTHLSPVPIAERAREIGLPIGATSDLLRDAERAFASARGCERPEIGAHLEELRIVATGRWPRSSIVRRAGTARRRTWTAAGVLGTLALVIGSGTLVAQGEEADASLSDQGFSRKPVKVDTAPAVPVLEENHLLEANQVVRLRRGMEWTAGKTHDNTEGNGLVLPCQRVSFADPDGLGAYVRDFTGTPRKGKKGPAAQSRAVEMVELSRSIDEAETTFETALAWFTNCSTERTQMLEYATVPGVGDEAALITLRDWRKQRRTIRVGVARTGHFVTTTVSDTPGGPSAIAPDAQVLGAAVNALCGVDGAGACAAPPKPRQQRVPAAGEQPGMLSAFDLPPVPEAPGPWAGNNFRKGENLAATRCDSTQFTGRRFRDNLTRSFLFPSAKQSAFGLTQTVGRMGNAKQAREFISGVRDRVAACEDEFLGSEVRQLGQHSTKKGELTAWSVVFPLPGDRTLQMQMAIIRHGNTVSQVGFVRDGRFAMSDQEFVWTARRALERLPRLTFDG